MALTLLPYGLKGLIYRSPMPFSRFDMDGNLLREFKECEISVAVMLIGDEEARMHSNRPLRTLYEEEGMQVIQLDVRDYDIPELEELRRNVLLVKELAEAGRNVVIHCHAGIGRTGLFAACLKMEIDRGSGEDALAWVREHVDGAVESDTQIMLVKSYLVD